MKIAVTGTSSGLGAKLANRLHSFDLITLTRRDLDLSNIDSVLAYDLPVCDMLINCAGTGVGGKIDFVNHAANHVVDILTTNLISPVILSQKALRKNPQCKIVNVTSTNNNRYYPNDLAYSLSKSSLDHFGSMLKTEYPNIQYLEIRLGLTKTGFNDSRYKFNMDRYQDVYHNAHLHVDQVADKILSVLFDPMIKKVEISP